MEVAQRAVLDPDEALLTTTLPVSGAAAALSIPGYVTVREISHGGQGVVYQAIQSSTKRRVAIKLLRQGNFAHATERTRFQREVEILGQLKHPNIVTIHDSGTIAGHAYYVMDYVSGVPLDEYVAKAKNRESKSEIPDLLSLFVKVCDAVQAAHLRGIIHRDLKPSNIRVDPAGEPHILDFGLAKVGPFDPIGDGAPRTLTMTGQFLGSLAWSAPEQADGTPSKIDIRTDVYSLGVMLYQMLTGRFPYDVTTHMRDVLDRIMCAAPVSPRGINKLIDDDVETIVLKCLAKEPERRYQSAGELGRDLAHYLCGEPIEAKRDSGLYLLKKALRRHRRPVAVGVAFLLTLIGALVGTFILWTQARGAQHEAELRAHESRQSADGLEVLLHARGDFAAAEPYFRDVLAHVREHDGHENPHLATALHNLAGVLRAKGDYAEAERLFRESLMLRRKLFGANHHLVAQSFSSMAALLNDQGRYREAEAFYREALSIPLPPGPRGRVASITLRVEFGRTLVHLERFAEAEKYLLDSHDEALAGPCRPPPDLMLTILEGLVEVYDRWYAAEPDKGYDAEAAGWRTRLEAACAAAQKR
jgi:tRNA A-37 threonylcarbamoyl transferase component Bud32/tetratricopeptide (TPR) repeat protein